MHCVLLAVNQFDTVAAAQANQSCQCDFGGIRRVGEHGFSEYSVSDRHAIQSTSQLSVHPCFHAVRSALCMQRFIGCHHGRDNPGAVLPFPRGAGARLREPGDLAARRAGRARGALSARDEQARFHAGAPARAAAPSAPPEAASTSTASPAAATSTPPRSTRPSPPATSPASTAPPSPPASSTRASRACSSPSTTAPARPSRWPTPGTDRPASAPASR